MEESKIDLNEERKYKELLAINKSLKEGIATLEKSINNILRRILIEEDKQNASKVQSIINLFERKSKWKY